MRRVIVARWTGVAALVCLGWATWSAEARANVPTYLTEQGRLFDTAGNPILTAVSMEFNFYGAATGGTSLWRETQSITPDKGYFSAELGSTTPFPAGIFATAAASGETLYLGITVGTDGEISPRQPLQSVPYALVADNAVGNITPATVSVGGTLLINAKGQWVGPSTGLVGPTGPAGTPGAAGPKGDPGAAGATGAAGSPGTNGTNGATGPIGPIGPQGPTGPSLPVGVANGLATLNGSAQVTPSQLPYGVANGIAQADATGRTPAASVRNGLISVKTVTATGPANANGPNVVDIPGLVQSLATQKGDILICIFSGQFSMSSATPSGGVAQLYGSDASGTFSYVAPSQMQSILTAADVPAQTTTGIWTVGTTGTTTIKGSMFANGGSGVAFSGIENSLTIMQIRP